MLKALNIPCTAITKESVNEDRSLWAKVERGDFRIIYAVPEVIFGPTSHFWKSTLRTEAGQKFINKLVSIVLDEVHVLWAWNSFREAYRHAGGIRECLSSVPIVGLSATLTTRMRKYVEVALKMRDPILIRETIYRPTLAIRVA